jgi:short-subunit dehydrogenase
MIFLNIVLIIIMALKDKYGSWAVIAGSAEGLGEAWSRALAQKGMNLIMVDHQEEKLLSLSGMLRKEYEVETIAVHIDLSAQDAYSKIMEHCEGPEIRLLIYNAAFSRIKPFISHTDEELNHFIGINTHTQLKLVHAFSKHLIHHKKGGGIILMSSLAGLIGMQLVAPYAATKAFAWNLAEGISHELKPHHIDVMACIAGATATPAYLKTNPQYGSLKPLVMKPEDVVEAAITKLGHKNLFIPGFSNRFNYWILTSLLPRELASRLANSTMKKMYAHLSN